MSDLSPGQTVTFTVTSTPKRPAQIKTIRRLMQMQPEIRKGLKHLARRRAQKDNDPRRRAGQIWVHRKRATKLVRVEKGEQFTLEITPQIIPDIKSVDQHLKAG